MKYNEVDIKEYITLEHPSIFKEYLIVWILTISSLGVLFAVCDPFTQYIFNLIMPIIVVMDLFAMFILVNVWRWQKLYILFIGIYCFSLSIILFLGFYKIIYLILGIQAPFLLIFSLISYLIIVLMSQSMVVNALKKGIFTDKTRKKKTKGYVVITGMAGVGVLIGRLLITATRQDTFMIIVAFLILFWSYMMSLGMHNIYKYYLIRTHESFVHIHKNDKKKKL